MNKAEKLVTIAENQQKVFDAGVLSAYQLKGTASGEVVSISDVAPVEHNMAVKLESKNLIPFPYKDTSRTYYGIEFTVNNDGTVMCNGTATSASSFNFVASTNPIKFPKGTYYWSCLTQTQTGVSAWARCGTTTYRDTGNGIAITLAEDTELYFYVSISSGTTVDNLVLKPQIEKGTVATSYTPYIEDISTVKLDALGKNIYDPEVRITPKTEKGLTIQYLEDEDCYLLNGTTTSTHSHYLLSESMLVDDYVSFAVKVVSGTVNNTNNGYMLFYLGYKDTKDGTASNWTSVNLKDGTNVSKTAQKYIGRSWFYISEGITFDNYKVRLSVEKGTGAKEYTPFIEPTTYTPNANGTVEGVKSIYPTTTLVPSEQGVLVECEYYQDARKVKQDLTDMIISLGGIIDV